MSSSRGGGGKRVEGGGQTCTPSCTTTTTATNPPTTATTPSTPVLCHHHHQLHPCPPSLPRSPPSPRPRRTQSSERAVTNAASTTITPPASPSPPNASNNTTSTSNITISLTPPPSTTTANNNNNNNNTSRSPPTSSRAASSSSTTHHLSPYSGQPSHTHGTSHKKHNTADSRLVVLGCPAVGKSALVVRLLTGRFIWEYDPTLESAYRHHTLVDDEAALMDILDTAGQGEGMVREGQARWGEGFLLVFSLTDRASFTSLPALHASLAGFKATPHFPCVIVANKTDLGHLAEVKEEEAIELAGELGVSVFLTSASEGGPTIMAAFTELHREVVRRRWSRRRRSSAKTVIEGFYKMFSR